jgi:3-oxoacyl-[acyl-carrier-protein] synthase II
VVITGIGSVSALGVLGGAALAAAISRGGAGLGPVRAFLPDGCASRLGGEVGDLASHLTEEEVRRVPRVGQLTLVAARLALADAGLDPGAIATLGLVLGSHLGDLRSSENFALGFLGRGPLGLSPLLFPATVMNSIGAHTAIALGVRGPMATLNQSGVAGLLAVARAASFIGGGRAQAVLAGGADELSPITYRELSRLGVTSPRASGTEGCWPFDRRANGTVLGEGATFVLLEAGDAAAARGARVYAALAGADWGNLPAPAHGVPPRRRRHPEVIRRALARAGVDRVAAVYLTGTGDPEPDACELDLVASALGGGSRPALPPLTALTPLAGAHAGLDVLSVAAGAAATIAGGWLPALPDLVEPIRPDLPLAVEPLSLEAETVLVHGFARGGTEAALILRRPDEALAA